MRKPWLGLVLAVFVCPAPSAAAEPTPGSCDDAVGVWDYKEPVQGRSIIAKVGERYTFVYFALTERQAGPTTGERTQAQKAAALDGLAAGAAEYRCEGSGGRLRWEGRSLYAAHPDPGGDPTWTLEMELDGDDARWWFLGPQGERGQMLAARRVR